MPADLTYKSHKEETSCYKDKWNELHTACGGTQVLILTHIHSTDNNIRVSKMAYWVRVLAVNPDSLGLTPSPTQWKVRTDSCKLFSELKPFVSYPIP